MVTKTSEKGIEFIASFEGFVNHPYNDPTMNATIGYGHLLHHGPVTPADRATWGTITHAKGLQLLAQDLLWVEHCILTHVTPPLQDQWRFDALASFIYNEGCGPLTTPTHLRDAVNNPARKGMPAALLPWDISNGIPLPGLARRRRDEANLWENEVYI